jgi:hypothetical protein
MIQRCTNPRHKHWDRYGGSGITVCDHWLDFENFLQDMGRMPRHGLTLDRVQNHLGYGPGNVEWRSREEQSNNRRNTIFLTIEGRRQPVCVWAREKGIDENVLRQRAYRGVVGEKLFAPVLATGRRAK